MLSVLYHVYVVSVDLQIMKVFSYLFLVLVFLKNSKYLN